MAALVLETSSCQKKGVCRPDRLHQVTEPGGVKIFLATEKRTKLFCCSEGSSVASTSLSCMSGFSSEKDT